MIFTAKYLNLVLIDFSPSISFLFYLHILIFPCAFLNSNFSASLYLFIFPLFARNIFKCSAQQNSALPYSQHAFDLYLQNLNSTKCEQEKVFLKGKNILVGIWKNVGRGKKSCISCTILDFRLTLYIVLLQDNYISQEIAVCLKTCQSNS